MSPWLKLGHCPKNECKVNPDLEYEKKAPVLKLNTNPPRHEQKRTKIWQEEVTIS